MGWFKKALTKVTKSPFGKAMDTLTTAYVSPVKTISAVISKKRTVKQVREEHFKQPLASQLTKTVLSTVGYATALYGGASVGTAIKTGSFKAGASSIAKSLIPKTTKGRVITALALPVVAGAVIREPTKTIGKVASAPSELAKFGGDVATFVSDPSIQTAKNIVKESPIITAGLVGAGVLAGGVAVAPAVSGFLTRQAIKDQTEVIKNAQVIPQTVQPAVQLPSSYIPLGKQEDPILPERQKITTGKRQYKRRRAKKKPSVRQSVRVNIINKPTNTGIKVSNKRYINNELLN